MRIKISIFCGMLLLTGVLKAQTDFRPGYIISKSGDTLSGEIDYRGDLLMSAVCKFKNDKKEIIEYSPLEITGFRFIGSKYLVAREINGRNVFLEYLVKGRVSIFYLRDNTGDHFFIDKEGIGITEIPYKPDDVEVATKQTMYKQTKHMGVLHYYMQDAPELEPEIQKIKKPDHNNLVQIAELYNNAVCKDEKCVIYSKKLPVIRINPELNMGIINYNRVNDLNDKFYLHSGIIGHIWLPRSSEKLYFRAGVLFSRLEIGDGEINFFKIPVQLEYIFPRGILRPTAAYGLNLYRPYFQTVSVNFGAHIALSRTLYLSATSDIEFFPSYLIFPKAILSYSLKMGVFWKFE